MSPSLHLHPINVVVYNDPEKSNLDVYKRQELNGSEFMGRQLVIKEARPRD